MANRERYKLIHAHTQFGAVNGWSIVDTEHPLIGYPVFSQKEEAESYRAGMYGLTREEYKRLHRQTGQKRQRIKNDNKPLGEE